MDDVHVFVRIWRKRSLNIDLREQIYTKILGSRLEISRKTKVVYVL